VLKEQSISREARAVMRETHYG